MKSIYLLTVLLCSALLLSCQSTSQREIQVKNTDALYIDQSFPAPTSFYIETEQEIFMLDDDMISMIENKVLKGGSEREKAKLLLKQIFSQDNIALSYATNANVTARDAFHSKTANCMSLTIMAYALAEAAGLKPQFQQVNIPEYWVRNGQYNLLTGHVNLIIKPQVLPGKSVIYGARVLNIDFDPYVIKQSFPSELIQKNTVMAMFYNNKGSQALVSGNYPLAYQYLKAATQVDPLFSSAWGNLAVLYKFTNNTKIAEQAYRHAIYLKNDNLTALANLSILLRSANKLEEAKEIDSRLLLKRKTNPYYHAVLADEAYYRKNYNVAISHYKKAIKLDNSIHEFYFGLAKAYYQIDKFDLAKLMMRKAIKFNHIDNIENQYIAKLNFLNTYHVN